MKVQLPATTTSQIEHLLGTASLMVNAANQMIIYFDKPENLSIEDVECYLSNLKPNRADTSVGCGDPA